MCGRFGTDERLASSIEKALDLSLTIQPNIDTHPSTLITSFIEENGYFYQLDGIWGIKPEWSRGLIFNAKAETIHEKKTFKEAYRHRRCLIPISCWYEWKDEGKPQKTRYRFSLDSHAPLLMAGIYYQHDYVTEIVSLTTEPTEQCARYHPRMPLLYPLSECDTWLLRGEVHEWNPHYDIEARQD